ncbi:MAG: PHP domain-containing protein [Eubacteriales bacterium]
MIDLHTHSTCSDGSMTPRELVRHAKASGLEAMALSDHDGIDGVADALDEGKNIGIEVIPAVELSVQSETETHILGYYIDINDKRMHDELAQAKKVRMQRNYEYSAKLKTLGFDVSVEDAARASGWDGSSPLSEVLIARAHFARVMFDRGYVPSVKYAFDTYLANGCPAYSSLQYFTPEQGVELIKSVGGMAFVAHLHLTRKSDEEMVRFLTGLKAHGLDGIEGYYTEYTPEMADKYRAMASSLGLMISGGTDFHGSMKPHISIGRGMVNNPISIPYSVLADIKAEHKRQITK